MVPAPKTHVEAFMPSSLAASLEGPIPTTPPHILAGGSGDNAAPTAPVEIVERLEDSFIFCNAMESSCLRGNGGQFALEPAIPPAPAMPPPEDLVNPPPPPSPKSDTASDAAVLDMGF